MKFKISSALIMSIILLSIKLGSADVQKTPAPKDSVTATPMAKLPKMIDLGSKGCIPCKQMAPILEDLKGKYKGKAEVIFIDVKEDRKAALKHKVTLIPTQIFFDTNGLEIFRHVGFFPADSIRAHFKDLGAEL